MQKHTKEDTKQIHKLLALRNDYIDTELSMQRTPVAPICIVNASHIAMSDNSLALRNRILIPLFVVLCIACFFHVKSFYNFWIEVERSHLDHIEGKKVKHGSHYFLETEKLDDLTIFYRIDVSGAMSLSDYLSLRYQSMKMPFYSELLGFKYFELISIFSYIVGIPYFFVKIVSFRRRAPIFFDRDRRIAYTWRLGQAWVVDYADMEFASRARALTFFLYSSDPEGGLQKQEYSLQPSGSFWGSDKAYYEPVLSAICQFMEKGIDRIWKQEWSQVKGILLRSDKMPSDLHEQITFLRKALQARK